MKIVEMEVMMVRMGVINDKTLLLFLESFIVGMYLVSVWRKGSME
jgi:hypothetical protein